MKSAAIVLAASLAACASTNGHRAFPPSDDRSAGVPKEPACAASVDDDFQVLVGGVPMGLNLTDLPFGAAVSEPMVTVHPLDDRRILLAPSPSWHIQGGAPRLSVLWEVPCAAPASRTELIRIENADFGHSVLSLDRTRLYFTGPSGVDMLDLQTKRVSAVTSAPLLDEETCWAAEGPEGIARADDVVVGWAEDEPALVIQRGGPCGYEADWVGEELLLLHPDDPSRRALVERAPVSSIAVDARGVLWLGDAGRCDEPGISDPQTPGAAWRSDDGGDTWVKVPFDTDELATELPTAARAVLPDTRPGTLLVLTGACSSSAIGDYGGDVLISRDAGESFTQVPLPPRIEEAREPTGAAIEAIEMMGGTSRHLRIWHEEGVWETTDGGATWKQLEDPPEPALPPKIAKHGERVLRATSDGLMRQDEPNGPARRVFPPSAR